MAVQPIVQFGSGRDSQVLAEKTLPVETVDKVALETIRDLLDTLHAHKIAVGLAAPQIGVSLSIAVVNIKTPDAEDIVLINPQITSETGKRDKKKESCMSLRDKRGDVVRRSQLEVSYMDRAGSPQTISATGFLARVLAHEIDHLNGILYSKRMTPESRLETVDFTAWERDSKRPSSGAS